MSLRIFVNKGEIIGEQFNNFIIIVIIVIFEMHLVRKINPCLFFKCLLLKYVYMIKCNYDIRNKIIT